MNVGTIDFENVPSLYLLASSKKIDDILNSDEIQKDVLGYEALKKHVEMKPVKDDSEKTRWFGEFIKYKENSKLFSVSSGNITFSQKEGKNYYTSLILIRQLR
jgi:hypothetical protein